MGMSWTDTDTELMRAAIAEAQKAKAKNEIPVGAIIVLAGEVIGRGFNRTITRRIRWA